eukprot:g3152.t1
MYHTYVFQTGMSLGLSITNRIRVKKKLGTSEDEKRGLSSDDNHHRSSEYLEVTNIKPGGQGAKHQIQKSWHLHKIDDKVVTSMDSVRELIASCKKRGPTFRVTFAVPVTHSDKTVQSLETTTEKDPKRQKVSHDNVRTTSENTPCPISDVPAQQYRRKVFLIADETFSNTLPLIASFFNKKHESVNDSDSNCSYDVSIIGVNNDRLCDLLDPVVIEREKRGKYLLPMQAFNHRFQRGLADMLKQAVLKCPKSLTPTPMEIQIEKTLVQFLQNCHDAFAIRGFCPVIDQFPHSVWYALLTGRIAPCLVLTSILTTTFPPKLPEIKNSQTTSTQDQSQPELTAPRGQSLPRVVQNYLFEKLARKLALIDYRAYTYYHSRIIRQTQLKDEQHGAEVLAQNGEKMAKHGGEYSGTVSSVTEKNPAMMMIASNAQPAAVKEFKVTAKTPLSLKNVLLGKTDNYPRWNTFVSRRLSLLSISEQSEISTLQESDISYIETFLGECYGKDTVEYHEVANTMRWLYYRESWNEGASQTWTQCKR